MAKADDMIQDHIEMKIAQYLEEYNLPNTHANRYQAAEFVWKVLEAMEHEMPELFRRAYAAHLAAVMVEESLAALHNCN